MTSIKKLVVFLCLLVIAFAADDDPEEGLDDSQGHHDSAVTQEADTDVVTSEEEDEPVETEPTETEEPIEPTETEEPTETDAPTTEATEKPTTRKGPTTQKPTTRKGPTTQNPTTRRATTQNPTTTKAPISTTEASRFDKSIFVNCTPNSTPTMLRECSYKCSTTDPKIYQIPNYGKCGQEKKCMNTKCLESATVDRCQTASQTLFSKNEACSYKCTIDSLRRIPQSTTIINQNGAKCVVTINSAFFKRTRPGTCSNGRCVG